MARKEGFLYLNSIIVTKKCLNYTQKGMKVS